MQKEFVISIELFSDLLRVSTLAIIPEQKTIVLQKSWEAPNNRETQAVVSDLLRQAQKSLPPKTDFHLIINLHPGLATTIHSGTGIIRPENEKPITETELDQIIASALWKIFTTQRARAATILQIHPGESVLVDVEVLNILLDGHKVMNPVEFKARAAEVWCQETIAQKEIIELLVATVDAKKIVAINESAGQIARMVSGKYSQYVFAYCGTTQMTLYWISEDKITARQTINWGVHAYKAALMRELHLNDFEANEIISQYQNQNLSKKVQKEIHELLVGELAFFLNGLALQYHQKKFSAVYIYTEERPPVQINDRALLKRMEIPFAVHICNAQSISEKNKFAVQLEESEKKNKKQFDSALISVIAAYTRYPGANLKTIAQRRSRWLQA